MQAVHATSIRDSIDLLLEAAAIMKKREAAYGSQNKGPITPDGRKIAIPNGVDLLLLAANYIECRKMYSRG